MYDYTTDGDTITVTGCDYTHRLERASVYLNSQNASKFNLPAGIYIMEYIACFKNINLGDNLFFELDSPLCGYKPSQNFTLNNSSISINKERGYTETYSGSGVLETIVLHLISDTSGRSYDRYTPCAPSGIQWKYEFYVNE